MVKRNLINLVLVALGFTQAVMGFMFGSLIFAILWTLYVGFVVSLIVSKERHLRVVKASAALMALGNRRNPDGH